MTDLFEIDEETLQDIINIETGLLYPLKGFMNKDDFKSVVERYTLSDGQVFTIPVTLDIPEDMSLKNGQILHLSFKGKHVADMEVEDTYRMADADIEKVFRTLDEKHPGVRKEKERSPLRAGGKTILLDQSLLEDALKPEDTRKVFAEKGWKTVVGFQT